MAKLGDAYSGSSRERFLMVIVALAIFFAFRHFWYAGASQRLELTQATIAKEEEALKAKQDRLSRLSKVEPAKGTMPQADAEIFALREFNGNYTNLIRRLTMEEGEAGNLRLRKIALEKQEKLEDFNRVTLAVELEGTFVSVGRFLEGIERSKLLAEVSGIELVRQPGELKRCTAKIKLLGYVSRPL